MERNDQKLLFLRSCPTLRARHPSKFSALIPTEMKICANNLRHTLR